MRRLSVLFLLWFLAAPLAAQTVTAYTGATVIHTDGKPAIANAVVLVQDGKITAVGGPKTKLPAGANRVDVTGKFLVAGLVDAHVHFFQSGGLYTRPDGLDLRKVKPYAQELAEIRSGVRDVFRRYLASGVTAVADCGGPMWNFDVRAMADTLALAPRVAVAGPLISTVSRPQIDMGDPPIVECKTPDEARAMVAKQAARKPDFIKVWYIADDRDTNVARRNYPIVLATAQAAKAAGLRLMVHATQLHTAKLALQAGADILVHSVETKPVDEEFLRLAKQRNILYIPTLTVEQGYIRAFTQRFQFSEADLRLADPYVVNSLMDVRHIADTLLWSPLRNASNRRKNLRDSVPVPALLQRLPIDTIYLHNLKRVHAAGIRVAMGTDAGNIGTLPGPSIYPELEAMQQAGLTPTQVLHSATVGGAAVMGRSDIGRIAPGMLADFLILDADPREDIRHVQRIHQVVKGGVAYSQESLLPPDSPARVVQRQLAAYNARNANAFAATYHPEIELFNHPEAKPMLTGREALRQQYATMFARNPRLNCEIVQRTVQGNYVIDQERFWNGYQSFTATAIYQVEGGLIRRVWFLR